MRRFVRSLALLVAAACAVTPLAAATQRVEVRVLAPAAKPLVGVLVKIVAVDGDPFSVEASSDSGGTAEFVLPSAKRSYRLEIDHEDYAPFTETFDLSARRLQRGESVRLEVEMPPLTAAHLYNRGVRALQAEDLLAAEAALQRAVELEPSFLEGWRVLSLIYL
ncbi:MAG: hypothetical protein NDJ75_06480, partial [Thermoanaerobaculia bacterium]|nr:hypothetical protein [Thermoanaerobaculia bacterium]